ncbi:MAG TPA: cation diffusion facilitator family transporter [Acidimicrobiia bacterium]|nr:cation diffusion facilitator family transporter [Acidimicrobiia bacterium]
MHEGSRKAIAAAFFANLGIAISKFVAFGLTGAASMLAEAIHSVADTGNQGLLFLGGQRAQKAATRLHQFGYGRERYFWSFVVAVVLFSLGAMFALYEGINKLIHPHELESATIAFVVLGAAIVLEAFSLRTAVREARPARGERSWWTYIRTARLPELPVVLLEDVGALTGLVFALAGVGATVATDDPTYDALGSISIGVLLAVIAVVLMVEMKSLLIGEAAEPHEQAAIRVAIEDDPRVERIIHLRTQHLGPEELLVAAKVDLGSHSADELYDQIDALEARVRAAVPTARVIYIEPDEFDPGRISRGDAAPH